MTMKNQFFIFTVFFLLSINSFSQGFKIELLHELKEIHNVFEPNFDNKDNIILSFRDMEGNSFPVCGYKILYANDYSTTYTDTIDGVPTDKYFVSPKGTFLMITNQMIGGGEFFFQIQDKQYKYKKTLYFSNEGGYYHIKLRDVAFSTDEEYIAFAGWVSPGGTLDVYKTSKIEKPFFSIETPTNSLVFSPDNKYIIAGSPIGYYTIFSVKNNFKKISEDLDWGAIVSQLTFSQDGKYLANILTNDEKKKTIAIHTFKKGELKLLKNIDAEANKIFFTKDGNYFFSINDTTIKIYSVKNNFDFVTTIDLGIHIDNSAYSINSNKLLIIDKKNKALRVYQIIN